MPPGWYGDPWGIGALRWWDGTWWTPYVHGPGPLAVREQDLRGVESWGRRASIALAVGAAVTVAQYLLWATLLHSLIHDFVHQLRVYSDQLDTDPNGDPPLHLHLGHLLLLELTALPLVVVEILLMIWLYQAAELGARLRLRATLSPVWAILGFLVPVVNLWFPYLVARDLLPADHPERRLVIQWWLAFLFQSLLPFPILVVSFYSFAGALALALVSSAVPLLCAWRGRQLIAAVSSAHRGLAGFGPAVVA